MAFETGPFETAVAVPRVVLALESGWVADARAHQDLESQVRLAWIINAPLVADAARKAGAGIVLRTALRDRPDDLRRLDSLLARALR